MALTKEQIHSLIKENDEIKKIFELFKENNLNTIISNYSVADEYSANICFFDAYRKELEHFFENGGNHMNVNSPEFRAVMDELEIPDFSDIYYKVENNLDSEEKNPLCDPTLTEAQRNGLRNFHKWLYRNADKSGFIGLGSDGSMRDFANNFMKQPAAVQLKALYLLQTGKRKAPDESGLDDISSQLSYVPDLSEIKQPLIASRWKFWRRTNGTQFYWNKLSDSLNIAMEDAKELANFRNEMVKENNLDKGENSHVKNGFGEKAYLKAIDKVIAKDNFKTANGEVDGYKKILVTSMRRSLKAAITVGVSPETKEKAVNKIYRILGIDGAKTESRKTFKGFDDFVQSGILAHEDNYTNAEYAMQSVLLTLSEDVSFADVPTFKELISSHPLAEIPGSVFDGLALGADIVNFINHVKEVANAHKNAGKLQQVSTVLDAAGDVADFANRIASIGASGAKILGESEAVVNEIANYAEMCTGVYNVLSTVNSSINVIDTGLNRRKISKAEVNAEKLTDKNVTNDIKNIAEVSRLNNEKKQHSAMRGMVKGGLATAMSFGSSSIGTIPVVGQIMLAGVVGLSVYEQIKEEKNRRELSRKTVDNLVIGKNNINDMANKFIDKLEKKLKKYNDNTAEHKKLLKLIKNKEKAMDKIRNEEAVKQGNTSLFSSTSSVMENLGEKMLKQVYLIDSNGEFTEDNLITTENKEEVYKKHKEKISYKDLLESTGQTVKFEKKKSIMKKGLDKYEKEIKDKVSKQISK